MGVIKGAVKDEGRGMPGEGKGWDAWRRKGGGYKVVEGKGCACEKWVKGGDVFASKCR